MRAAFGVVALLVACAGPSPPPDAPVAPPGPRLVGPAPACGPGQVADRITHVCLAACGPAPPAPPNARDSTCESFTLPSGQSFHDQFSLQQSDGAGTRLDCPRMRFRGQDTPVCVAQNIGGRMRAACCPPGHTDPSDPECVGEGFPDEQARAQRVLWEWCDRTKPLPKDPCRPCVWITGAQR